MCKVNAKVWPELKPLLSRALTLIMPFARLSYEGLAEGLIDYYLGLSFRASSVKRGYSHTSLWRYWHMLSKLKGRVKIRLVAMDETGFRFAGRRAFVWYVVDVNRKLVVEACLSVNSRTAFDVLKIVGELGFEVEYVHDGGPWYGALEWIKAKHKHETFGIRNSVEQAFRSLKHRVKRFNHFRGSLNRALNWLRSFTYIHNLITTISQGVMAM